MLDSGGLVAIIERMKLNPDHPALSENRTIHPKMVMNPILSKNGVLKPSGNNSKLGRGMSIVMKGKWRGVPMFSLTLQERATCPNTCHHWATCYGNNMGLAHRYQHGPELVTAIEKDLEKLFKIYPKIVVRLHVLGDFYSVEYVQAWERFMRQFPGLYVFGYTARDMESDPIGQAVKLLRSERWWVRQSTNDGGDMTASNTNVFNSIVCPQQTGKTASCLTCGLCWSVTKPIQFLAH